ncbi:DUF4240 domain-containing protein [Streptomyces sp. NPDC051018]|uniref:DUF4240 domain-containing protein n=1 Tax=Streptomyces sp. NPDC051018 TaxID=3365639 RepID=UPI00379E8AFE
MDKDQFWAVIEDTRTDARQSGRPFDEILADRLAAGSRQEVLAFDAVFAEVHGAVYRWDLWAAAYLIGGGCSDDGFMDFRAGLITLGRDWYERADAAPDSLADHPAVMAGAEEALFCEAVNYAASTAYERLAADGPGDEKSFYEAADRYRKSRAGTGGPGDGSDGNGADREASMGEEFDFDDDEEMYRRLPHLAALCLGEAAPDA